MLMRVLALLGLCVCLFIVTYIAAGEAVVAWFWFAVGYTKVMLYSGWKFALTKLPLIIKAQIVNFLKIEVGKRWFLKSGLWLLLGTGVRRMLKRRLLQLTLIVKRTRKRVVRRYTKLARPTQILLGVGVIAVVLLLSLVVWWAGLVLLLFRLPSWLTGPLWYIGNFLWGLIQKLLFRTIAFAKLYRLWNWSLRWLPQGYVRRLRAYNFRLTRRIVKSRKLTAKQLHRRNRRIWLRLEVAREQFRRRKEAPEPTANELATAKEQAVEHGKLGPGE